MHALIDLVLAMIEPAGFAWLCLVIILIAFARKRQWRAVAALAVPTLVLFVFGSTDAPGFLMRDLERPYAGMDIAALPHADAIVLLGRGAQPARFEVADMHLTPAGD